MGIIAYADDFTVSCEGGEADCVWDETTGVLGETGLEIDQSMSCYSTKATTGWNHKTLAFLTEIVVLGTETTEWNSMAADEQDASLAQKRLTEASEFAGHFEAVARKSEGLWLMTSKSTARSLDFDAKVVNLQENETSGRDVTGQNEMHLRKIDGEITRR